ncbi:MAG TPA: 16S rRNA (cytidine(1402)-2'-O)-methyltransferase [Chloroflexi bacterium]|nr:16S rRNA (cytidine(1402)-2'-O)-methyltransferase [Chloroflexota bacterium]
MGTLYLVGTPIGNLEDLSLRALRVLEEAALIAAEDTRRARILTQHYQIEASITSYFEGNKLTKLDLVLDALDAGDVALISEAGMPGLSDPGYELIRAAIERGFHVTAIPGPSAPVTALVLSGLPSDSFLYLGFLPRRQQERRKLLSQVARHPYTLILFEVPHRLRKSLADVETVLGDRPVAVCRELTKLYEEVWRGTVSGARAYFDEVKPRGEFTLVIGGAPEEEAYWDVERVERTLGELLAQGVKRSDAARRVAALSGWPRSEVYALGLGLDGERDSEGD